MSARPLSCGGNLAATIKYSICFKVVWVNLKYLVNGTLTSFVKLALLTGLIAFTKVIFPINFQLQPGWLTQINQKSICCIQFYTYKEDDRAAPHLIPSRIGSNNRRFLGHKFNKPYLEFRSFPEASFSRPGCDTSDCKLVSAISHFSETLDSWVKGAGNFPRT
jgi:hypothetical protein